jgi:hypothetical protein
MHYKCQDTWPTVSICLDWRAEIHLTALHGDAQTPSAVAGFVDFLILRLGEESVAEVLDLYGERAAAFGELFSGASLAPDLDESDAVTGGMPISSALLILDAQPDDPTAL